jgi:hypothetical protein
MLECGRITKSYLKVGTETGNRDIVCLLSRLVESPVSSHKSVGVRSCPWSWRFKYCRNWSQDSQKGTRSRARRNIDYKRIIPTKYRMQHEGFKKDIWLRNIGPRKLARSSSHASTRGPVTQELPTCDIQN